MGVTHMRRCALLLAAAAVAHALSPQTDEDDMDAGGVDAPGGKCKYTSPDGYNFDLNGMKRTDHDYLGTTPGGYLWTRPTGAWTTIPPMRRRANSRYT